mmetsp:Transcript_61498/g.199000  ORF Transcript_61498/g.199000 Transcript_61498/m.199000 type:complete len:387 (-) Transcript_61498:25-1185(-)
MCASKSWRLEALRAKQRSAPMPRMRRGTAGLCSIAVVGEGPLRDVRLLVSQVLDGVFLAPLVLPGELVDVAGVRTSHAIEACDGGATEAGQGSEDSALLLSDLCTLELVNHLVALFDRGLGQLLSGVLAAKGLEVAVGHLHVRFDTGVVGGGGSGGLGVGIGGLLGLRVAAGHQEAVQGAIGEFRKGVRGLREDGNGDGLRGLEVDLVQTVLALHRHRARDLDLLSVGTGGQRHGPRELLVEIHGQGRVDLQLAVELGRRGLRGGGIQGVLEGLEAVHDRGLRDLRLHDRLRQSLRWHRDGSGGGGHRLDLGCGVGLQDRGCNRLLALVVVMAVVVLVVVLVVVRVMALKSFRHHDRIGVQDQQRGDGGGGREGCKSDHPSGTPRR